MPYLIFLSGKCTYSQESRQFRTLDTGLVGQIPGSNLYLLAKNSYHLLFFINFSSFMYTIFHVKPSHAEAVKRVQEY
jgi:hypothetical protein